MSEVFAAVLGALVVWGTTYFMEKKKRGWAKEENATHLGVVVLVLLERFIADCAKVAGDDGTVMGRPAGRTESGEEYRVPQTDKPKLDLDGLKVEWRSISPALMYSIHSIPLSVTQTLEYLKSVGDNDFPPYDDYIESRQHQFAKLGVEVTAIAKSLREETGIPARPPRDWSPEEYLSDRLAVLVAQREKLASQIQLDT